MGEPTLVLSVVIEDAKALLCAPSAELPLNASDIVLSPEELLLERLIDYSIKVTKLTIWLGCMAKLKPTSRLVSSQPASWPDDVTKLDPEAAR